MSLIQFKDFFLTHFFPKKNHTINNNESEVTSRKINVLDEIEKNQEININVQEFSNKPIEIVNVYTSYIQMFLLFRPVIPKELIPFLFNHDEPSRDWPWRWQMDPLHFIRPYGNLLWFEFTEEDWTPYHPHSHAWVAGLADYSVCLLEGWPRLDSDEIYYNSSDLYEQSFSFPNDKDVKLKQTDLILTSKQDFNKKIF